MRMKLMMRNSSLILLFLFLICFVGCSPQQQYPHIAAVDSAVQQFIDSAWLPNAVCYVSKDGRILHLRAYGWRDQEKHIACQTDDLFRLASQTKALTAVGFMQLYEQGLCGLDDPVERYIPEFAGKGITCRHLLTHTSGICYDGEWEQEYIKVGALAHNSSDTLSLAENVRRMALLPLKHKPGEAFTYSNNTDVIGRIIEVVSGENYVDYIQRHILVPLEMNHTYFYLPCAMKSRLVTLYSSDSIGLKRVVEDENLFAYGSYPSPSAGLCGTIEDYARFCQMLLDDGIYQSDTIIKKETLRLMQRNHVGRLRSDSLAFGLAWDVFPDSRKMRWGGMYGTDYIIDPDNGLILIFYTNCRPNRSGHNHKQAFIDAVYSSCVYTHSE